MNAEIQHSQTRRRGRPRGPDANSQRKRRIPYGCAPLLLVRGDRAAPSYRARRRPAAGAASRRRGDRRLSVSGRGRPGRFRRAVRRQADARDLQLHVRTATRAPLSDVHQSFGRLGGQRGRHRAEDLACGGRALADRAPDRLETRARLARPSPLQRSQRRLFARLFAASLPNGSEIPAFNVFTRRDGTIRHFWSGEMADVTADPGQDPRGAPDPAPLWMVLELDARGAGGRLVSEARLRLAAPLKLLEGTRCA